MNASIRPAAQSYRYRIAFACWINDAGEAASDDVDFGPPSRHSRPFLPRDGFPAGIVAV